MKYLIIGNGIAGIQAAETIRGRDPQGEIIMVSREDTLPYSRPLISYIVSGELKSEQIVIRPDDFYSRFRIETYLGDTVVEMNPENHTVRLESGKQLSWDRLLIASGADPRFLDVKGNRLGNIFTLRNQSDAEKIVSVHQNGACKALVLGGGLVGFKAAYGLLKRGVKVTMLITSQHPLSQVADNQSGKMIRETLEAHGLQVRVGKSVVAFSGRKGKVHEAILDDGTSENCDLVVVGKGVRPAVSFLKHSGIDISRGVIVNDMLQTSIPGIYAAGDVAESFDIAHESHRVNAIWPVASEQGRVAALNMTGRRIHYSGSLGRNVIKIFDLDFMAAGVVRPGNNEEYGTLSAFDPGKKIYKKLVFRRDFLVGMVLVNDIDQGGVLCNLIKIKREVGGLKRHLLESNNPCALLSNVLLVPES